MIWEKEMIYSVIPTDVIFFDREQLRERHFKVYNCITLELDGKRIERIISTNPHDFIKYGYVIGKNIDDESLSGKFIGNMI